MSLSRSRKPLPEPKVEINIVPLVDVSLVLLIIFMVTATFVKTAGMQIQLPTSSLTRSLPEQTREVVIGIDKEGRFLWQGAYVQPDALAATLQAEARAHGTKSRVIVQGDARAAHGRVVQAMTMAQQAGFANLAISTRQEVRGSGDAQ